MKKSIFLFFAAILCAMTANAQLYLRGGFNDWGATDAYKFVSNVCSVELAGGTTYEFKVADSGWGTNYGGNVTFTATATKTLTKGSNTNAKITTTIPGTYKFEFVESTKKLTVTYPELPAPHDITVRAQVPAHWTNTITAWVWTSENGAGEEVTPTKDGDYYVVTKNAGALYVIFKNGAGWNGDKNQTVDLCYTEDVCLQLNQSSTATTKATATVIDCGAVSKDITVKAVVPGAWEDKITAWVWPTGGDGKEVTPTKEGNWYVITENCIELNVIFKNGEGWNGNENQTANIAGVSENTCYQISALTKDGEGKCTYTVVDCDATIEPEAKPEPTPTYDYYITGSFNGNDPKKAENGMTLDGTVYKATVTLAAGDNTLKVTKGSWDPTWGYNELGAAYEEVFDAGEYNNIKITLAAEKTITVIFDATAGKITFEGLTEKEVVTYDYYIAGTLAGGWSVKQQGMEKDGELYKHTFSELAAGTYEFKITDGQWNSEEDKTHEHTTLGAAYEEVSYNEGNIKIDTEEAINLTVIFDATADKITFVGLTEKAPAEPVTVYFINSGNWAEVACHYWGGLNGSEWPGVQMDLTAETYEAEGWNVYKVTFPGDNTSCIFNDNKAEGATQTGDLTVENGKYYCYANGIWYERLADVDPLDTRVYLKGDMNEWCDAGYCYMFRKETVDGTVAYSNVYLEEANTTYEFKIEDAGAWLSNTGTMTKDNCTSWTFEESVSDNAKITTEYVGEYTFVWDMTTKKLSVVYPDPKANPEVMALTVTDMVYDGNKTFSGTDNMMGVEFTLVLGEDLGDGIYSLDASSTVNFGGTLFTDVTGMIAPDTETFASASATVYGFYMGMYFQLNVEMSAGGAAGVPVEILDGTASVDGAGELTISGNWDGDDVYVVAPGFNGVTYDCDEVWFYVGGTTWETASIIAFGPASITVEGNDVTVEGTVMSGMTGTNYDLFVIGTFPTAPETYTRTVTNGQWGTICLPNASSSFTGATFYEVSSLVYGEGLWLNQLANGAQLVAGKPYIFQATATEIVVTYTGAAVGAPIEGANGLTGTFTGIAAGSLTGNYIIAENQVWVAGATATLPANRAYINAADVPTTTQAEIPGRRRVLMGENAATGVDNIVAPEGQAVKAIVNGQLIIIRDGVKYNVQGQKL